MSSSAHWHAFLYLHALIKTFFYFIKNQKKNWAKWAKWARIHKNTLANEQLSSLTCFFVSAFLNMYRNIHSFIAFEIRKKDGAKWAKWAKWARLLKITLTDEQLCSLICFFVSALLNMFQNIYLFITFKIKKEMS